jgi:iron(III) transport system ATP-binding protein
MIAGFDKPDAGDITICGYTVVSFNKNIVPEKRKTGMVFQDYALFPHLTVYENITFGPEKKSKAAIEKLISITGLTGSEKKYPHELSGGQQQRVALARALAPKPGLLLMDEPFSNLDIALRESLSEEVRFILNEYNITGLLVTHNQHEAFAMADRIGVLKKGQLLQWDTADNLYYKPSSYEVASFVGEGSFIKGNLNTSGLVKSEIGQFPIQHLTGFDINTPVKIFVRPEAVRIDPDSDFKARLIKSHFRGPGRLHTFELPSGDQFVCLDNCPKRLNQNKEYGISICNNRSRVFQ